MKLAVAIALYVSLFLSACGSTRDAIVHVRLMNLGKSLIREASAETGRKKSVGGIVISGGKKTHLFFDEHFSGKPFYDQFKVSFLNHEDKLFSKTFFKGKDFPEKFSGEVTFIFELNGDTLEANLQVLVEEYDNL